MRTDGSLVVHRRPYPLWLIDYRLKHHLQSAIGHINRTKEYQQLLAELDHLNICNYYELVF